MKKLFLLLLVASAVMPAFGWFGRGWGRGCYGCGGYAYSYPVYSYGCATC